MARIKASGELASQWQEPEEPLPPGLMNSRLGLDGAAACHGLLTGQTVLATVLGGVS